jgi:hypothetical protein
MSTINMRGVIVGGLVAGLVINISEAILNMPVLGAQMEAELARLNLPPVGGGAIGLFMLLGFVVGILTVWLYAAMRPRFGAGPKTAVLAGLVVWFLGYLYPTLGMLAMGMFSTQLGVIASIWGLVEVVVAAIAGARVYTEPAVARIPA